MMKYLLDLVLDSWLFTVPFQERVERLERLERSEHFQDVTEKIEIQLKTLLSCFH